VEWEEEEEEEEEGEEGSCLRRPGGVRREDLWRKLYVPQKKLGVIQPGGKGYGCQLLRRAEAAVRV